MLHTELLMSRVADKVEVEDMVQHCWFPFVAHRLPS